MSFFIALVVDGVLAGSIYALIALAFVVVYKAARIINFALGECVMLGALLVAFGLHGLGLGLLGALMLAAVGMAALALLFSRLVLRRLFGAPLISLIMVTLGLGALIRSGSTIMMGGVPRDIALPIDRAPIDAGGLQIATDRLAAAIIAALCVALVAWFHHRSRTGVALRAIAEDRAAAMASGIDVQRYVTLTWVAMGVIAVAAGTLWTFVSGGGFSVALVGLKVFPIVIIGGLDSIPGTIVGAMLVGVLESLAAGYLDPSFGAVAAWLVLVLVLMLRPHGLFGTPRVERV
ncbi:MAG: branched-chain amino acid ABC transporter permease [Alphaproteobacteria bacterium]|nr:branched-chain amino acid ABC transporter permease [Alphaproteobacteria bacterium]